MCSVVYLLCSLVTVRLLGAIFTLFEAKMLYCIKCWEAYQAGLF